MIIITLYIIVFMCSYAVILPSELMMTLVIIEEQHSVENWNTLLFFNILLSVHPNIFIY